MWSSRRHQVQDLVEWGNTARSKDGGRPEKRGDLGRPRAERLLHQGIHDVLVVAAKGCDNPRGIGAGAKREAGQLERGDLALLRAARIRRGALWLADWCRRSTWKYVMTALVLKGRWRSRTLVDLGRVGCGGWGQGQRVDLSRGQRRDESTAAGARGTEHRFVDRETVDRMGTIEDERGDRPSLRPPRSGVWTGLRGSAPGASGPQDRSAAAR